MKGKFLLTLLAVLLMGQTVCAQSVFSPNMNSVRSKYQSRRAASPDAKNDRVTIVVTCSVETSTAAIANQMKELGAVVRVLMANQLVVDIPMSQLDAAAAIEGVLLIDMPSEGRQRTDTARKASHVDEVHAGKMEGMTNLPQAYTGSGVIIGLIDSGFDYTHPMFKDQNGNLRIIGVYQPWAMDEKHTGQPGNLKLENIPIVDEKGVSTTLNLTGSFYTNPDVICDTTIVKDTNGSHGVHCASIAAGRKMEYTTTFKPRNSTSGLLGGMAPDAQLILSEGGSSDEQTKKFPGVNLSNYNSMQALWAINYYAKQKGMPLVISWSENEHDGFHDGTSTMARYVGNYCKKDNNIMALCCGNEGADYAHFKRTIAKGGSAKIFYEPNSRTGDAYLFARTDQEIKIEVEVVDLDEDDTYLAFNLNLTTNRNAPKYQQEFSCEVKDNDGGYTVLYDEHMALGQKLYDEVIEEGTLGIYTDVGTGLDKNDQQFTYTKITIDQKKLKLMKNKKSGKDQYLRYTISSPNADVELLTWGDNANLFWNGDKGSTDRSVCDWNTTGEPITIGAYTTANNSLYYNDEKEQIEWGDESKDYPLGRYAVFSSYGHDYSDAQRPYPDVSAPGAHIYAACNSFSPSKDDMVTPYEKQFKGQDKPRNYPYSTKSGTSMATPAAAGIIALWVQAAREKGKPLTNKYMKEVIKNSSFNDDWTTITPIRYGAGKIDAYKGLLYILDIPTSIPDLPTRHIGATLNGRTLHIQGDPDVRVTVYSLSGQLLLDTQAVSGIVELPALPAGVYAVRIGSQGSTLIRL